MGVALLPHELLLLHYLPLRVLPALLPECPMIEQYEMVG
jgi:hypothetical protein